MQMTHRQIETSREIRLWITGILGPAVIGAATVIAGDPELRDELKYRLKEKLNSVSKKIKKRRES